MPNLNVTEIKAFVPARDFRCQSSSIGISALPWPPMATAWPIFISATQASCCRMATPGLAEQLMMHLLVEDVAAWRAKWRRARSPPATASGSRSSSPSRGA